MTIKGALWIKILIMIILHIIIHTEEKLNMMVLITIETMPSCRWLGEWHWTQSRKQQEVFCNSGAAVAFRDWLHRYMFVQPHCIWEGSFWGCRSGFPDGVFDEKKLQISNPSKFWHTTLHPRLALTAAGWGIPLCAVCTFLNRILQCKVVHDVHDIPINEQCMIITNNLHESINTLFCFILSFLPSVCF